MRYETAATSRDAARLLAAEKGTAFVLAGGTDLMVRMKAGMIEPDLVVDIKTIPATQEITKTVNGWKIGAAVSGAQMGRNKALKKAWPGVVEAASSVPTRSRAAVRWPVTCVMPHRRRTASRR